MPSQRIVPGSREVTVVVDARHSPDQHAPTPLTTIDGRSLLDRAIVRARLVGSSRRTIVVSDDPSTAEAARRRGVETIGTGSEPANEPGSVVDDLELIRSMIPGPSGLDLEQVVVVTRFDAPFMETSDIESLVARACEREVHVAVMARRVFGDVWPIESVADGGSIDVAGPIRSGAVLSTGSALAVRADSLRESTREPARTQVAFHLVDERRALRIRTAEDVRMARALSTLHVPTATPGADRLNALKGVVFDFDGVMTDNRVVVHSDGSESVIADRGDGMGIENLRRTDLALLILSKETNAVVMARASKLRIDAIHGCDDKLTALHEWCARVGITPEDCAYIGNDVNDIECLGAVALAVCPCDADPSIITEVDWVLDRAGGRGAVREFADAVMRARRATGSPSTGTTVGSHEPEG